MRGGTRPPETIISRAKAYIDNMVSTQARKHVLAWYSYAFAAEVFAACAMAIFLPITLEQMAREVGFVAPDLEVPCAVGKDGDVGDVEVVCKARILGGWVDTASFSMYVKSVAVVVQALSIISIGPLADSAYWRKRLLLLFAYIGSVSAILLLFFPSAPHRWIPLVTAILTVVGNAGYATSIVCANAFLPGLAREDPKVIAASKHGASGENEGEDGEGEDQALLPPAVESAVTSISTADLAQLPTLEEDPEREYKAILSLTTSRLSSTNVALGCFSGVAMLAVLVIPVTAGGGSTASLRLAIGLSGVWWAVFTVPAWIGLPGGKRGEDSRETSEAGTFLRAAWRRVGKMVAPKQVRTLPNLFTLLLAWVFLSDGFHTTTYTAILYASSSLRMSPSKIILIGILVQMAAVFSSIYTPKLQRKLGLSNLGVLLRTVVLALTLPFYACLGLVLPFGGLRTEGEMYVAAVWFGSLYGPFNSYYRAVFAELIPPGHESSFFSLFSLTDKSASFIGPFIVGLIADRTGNIRLGFLFLLAMLLLPIPVLLKVDMVQGHSDARTWAEERKRDIV